MSYGETLVHALNAGKVYPADNTSKRRYLRSQFMAAMGVQTKTQLSHLRVALKGVDLNVARGQALGIIGPNGAGKSTLLKLVQGSLRPDEGQIKVFGKVGGLIELTSGFQESLSGIDNIAIKARQLGLDEQELRAISPAIIEFSGLESRLMEPIRNYSTGMKARLGFSIATQLPYDVMLCDEALSVGDARFQQKCLARVTALKRERVFILVSHSMSHIRRFCDQVLVLNEGRAEYCGDVETGIKHYEEQILHLYDNASDEPKSQESSIFDPLISDESKVMEWSADFSKIGKTGFKLKLEFKLDKLGEAGVSFVLGIPILDHLGQMVTGFSCEQIELGRNRDCEFGLSAVLEVPGTSLNPGTYVVIAALQHGVDKFFRQIVGRLTIATQDHTSWGIYTPEHTLSLSVDQQVNR